VEPQHDVAGLHSSDIVSVPRCLRVPGSTSSNSRVGRTGFLDDVSAA
jgi:hypothetical protein